MRRHRYWLCPLAVAIVLLTASGCVTETREEMKNAAEGRWNTARAGVMFSMAQNQFEAGDLDKAEKTLGQALASKPDQPEFYQLSARIALERGNLEKAHLLLKEALKHNPKLAQAHYLRGVILQRWQRYDDALKAYDAAYQAQPDEPRGLLAAAEMLVKLGREDEAIQRLNDKLVYFENNAAIRISLGRIRMLRGEYDQAIKLLTEAAVLSAHDPHVVEQLAMAEYAGRKYAEAIFHLKSLLKTESHAERDDLRLALGDCYLATDQPLKARQTYLHITQREEGEDNINAWIKLGETAWLVGDHVRLGQAAQKVRSLAPDRHEGYLLQGLVERQAGKTEAAIRQFDQAVKIAPERSLPLILKGLTLEQTGDQRGARQAYRQALSVAPDDPRAKRLLAGLSG